MQAVDDDDEYASTLLACLEMLRNGVSCFLEPGTAYEPDAVASAAQRIGLRGSVTDPYLWDCVSAGYHSPRPGAGRSRPGYEAARRPAGS